MPSCFFRVSCRFWLLYTHNLNTNSPVAASTAQFSSGCTEDSLLCASKFGLHNSSAEFHINSLSAVFLDSAPYSCIIMLLRKFNLHEGLLDELTPILHPTCGYAREYQGNAQKFRKRADESSDSGSFRFVKRQLYNQLWRVFCG